MTKRTYASSVLAVIIFAIVVQDRAVVTAGGFDWAAFAAAEAAAQAAENENGQDAGEATPRKKHGNGFVRALGAPFRALGRLFGGGNSKKNEQAAASKISEKQAAGFESAKLTRIRDARDQAPDETDLPAPTGEPFGVYLQKGRVLLSAGNLNEAIAELTAAEALDPKSAEVQNLLGVAYGSKGLTDRALKAFETAVRADKHNPEYLNNYGFLLLKTSDFDAARKYLQRAAKLSPSDARIWNNLAIAQCQRGKFDDALSSFVKAVGEFDGRVNMAAQLLRQGMGQEAIKHLEVAQALRPNSIEVLTRLAGLYNMTGRISDAQSARRSLIALQTSAEAQK